MTDEEHVREFHVMYPTGEGKAADDDRLRRHEEWHEFRRRTVILRDPETDSRWGRAFSRLLGSRRKV